MEIEIRISDPRLVEWGFPHRGSAEAAGLDLHACVAGPIELRPGDPPVFIPAGFAMRIGDRGWCGLVAPRSGLGHRGLVLGNTIGVIDADYMGELTLSAWNRNGPGGAAITVAPGDRIAQLLLVPVAHPFFRVVEAFGQATERGGSGYGSSGVAPPGEAGPPKA